MPKSLAHVMLVALILLVAGCQHDPISEPTTPATTVLAPADFDAEMAAGEIMALSGWDFAPEVAVPERVSGRDTKCLDWIVDWSREELGDGIAHYSYLVRVGDEEYDEIMVHRVVKERRPGQPARARKALFLEHGSGAGFVPAFMASTVLDGLPSNHALPIYLAENGVDV